MITSAITGTPATLPVLATQGPADWDGLPLATFRWSSASRLNPTAMYARELTEVEGAKTLEDTLVAAVKLSNKNGGFTRAVGVLQAKNGAFFVGRLGFRGGTDADVAAFPVGSSRGGYGYRVESVTSGVDALRAVVGGSSWVTFPDVKAGDKRLPVAVPQEKTAPV